MRSPFPDMDPYLESHWRDVHHHLITYAGDQIQQHLPRDLRARVEERVFIEPASGPGRGGYPDLRVIEQRRRGAPTQVGRADRVREASTTVVEPLIIHLADEPASEGYIEIVDTGSNDRVVTVIEFLSPSNKQPGPGRDLYLQKQSEVLAARVSLVEIDLVRAGEPSLAVPLHRIPPPHRTAYMVCVHRGWRTFEYEVYPLSLREPLPTIRVPLRERDEDALLELQPLVDQCYRNGRFESLDYNVAPDPPLDREDAAWAAGLLRNWSEQKQNKGT